MSNRAIQLTAVRNKRFATVAPDSGPHFKPRSGVRDGPRRRRRLVFFVVGSKLAVSVDHRVPISLREQSSGERGEHGSSVCPERHFVGAESRGRDISVRNELRRSRPKALPRLSRSSHPRQLDLPKLQANS